MELADVTDSKSVGSNTVRVRPPPSAPKIIPRSTSGVLFLVRREGEPATCGSCMDARWRSRKVGARTRRPQRPQFDNPATLSPAQQAGYYFWCGGRENPQLAGKAWMPYKMNAQSFKQGCLKSAALSCHTMRQPKRLTRHDAKPTEQARRAKDAR